MFLIFNVKTSRWLVSMKAKKRRLSESSLQKKLNEELEVLNSEARELEDRISENVSKLIS